MSRILTDYVETAEWTLPMVSLDSFISIICLYFSFPFADKHYKKFCYLCHISCSKICIKLSERKYNHSLYRDNTLRQYLVNNQDNALQQLEINEQDL